MATEYERIKKAVEQQKSIKMQGEARITSLNDEANRILKEVSEELGKEVATLEDVKGAAEQLKSNIESNITKMKAVLEEEGVEY